MAQTAAAAPYATPLSDEAGATRGLDAGGAEASGSGTSANANGNGGGVGEKQKKKVKVGARASIACKTCRCVFRGRRTGSVARFCVALVRAESC